MPSDGIHMTLGKMIDELQKLKFRKKQLTDQMAELQLEIDQAETSLMAAMQLQNVTKSTGTLATASISESVVPHVQDWDSFYDFIKRHSYFHLLDRRPNVAGCRELFESKGVIPGVVPFTKRTVRTTSIA